MKPRNNKEIVRSSNVKSHPNSGARQVKTDNPIDSRRKGRLPRAEAVRDAKPDKGEVHRRCVEKQV